MINPNQYSIPDETDPIEEIVHDVFLTISQTLAYVISTCEKETRTHKMANPFIEKKAVGRSPLKWLLNISLHGR